MNSSLSLLLACAALVFLTFGVGLRMLWVRMKQMKDNKIHPQSVALSADRSKSFEDSRASDNYNHLFELPLLFYTLCAFAVALQKVPDWLVVTAWLFVASRYIHSFIQCGYNKVMHRFSVFLTGFLLLVGMWIGFVISLTSVS